MTTTAHAAAIEGARRSNGQFGTWSAAENDAVQLSPAAAERAARRAAHRAQMEQVNAREDAYASMLETIAQTTRATMRGTSADYGANWEDISQETAIEAISAENKGQALPSNGAMSSAAKRFCSRAFNASRRGNDPTQVRSSGNANQVGQKQYAAAVAAFTAENERQPTPKERDVLAEKVIAAFPAGRRPVPDFHKATLQPKSIDAGSEDSEVQALIDTLSAPEAHHLPEEDALERAASWDQIEAGDTSAARRQVHNDVLGAAGVPHVQAASMTKRQRTAVRTLVPPTNEGVIGALDEWDSGQEATPRADAFFAVYGDVDPDTKDQIAAAYRKRSNYAGQLFDSALLHATTK